VEKSLEFESSAWHDLALFLGLLRTGYKISLLEYTAFPDAVSSVKSRGDAEMLAFNGLRSRSEEREPNASRSNFRGDG
jgi:hypothetical protein